MPRALVLGSITTMMLAACASAGTTKAAAENRQGPDWHVVFQMSGGFAGMDRALDVDSAGALVATDRARRARVMGQVPAAELSRLAEMVRRTYPATTRDAPCPDCRVYDLEIRSGGRSSTWQLTDTNRPGHDLDPLLTALADLLDRALAGRLPSP